jgi:tol-pal system protein YbgF
LVKLRALLLFLVLLASGQAHAGLFSDDERKIRELEGRISLLEDSEKQRARALMGMQTQLDALSEEVRRLQGRNEELMHNLQDLEKRQKDFYIDLDSRLRRFEVQPQGQLQPGQTGSEVAAVPPPQPPADPAAENRDFDAANKLFKSGKQKAAIKAFLGFLQKYPASTLAPNAYYKLGVAYFELKDYKNAANSYQTVAVKYPNNRMAPGAMLGAAISYQEMGDVEDAKSTLNQLIANYPTSNITPKAKKRLKALK